MFKIIEYPKVQDFFNKNKKAIYGNRLAHYHLIKYFEELNAGRQSIIQAYNITDDDGGNVIAVWGDSVYYLYALKWSDAIIDGLLNKIEIAKYTKRFTFCGTAELVLRLFEKSGVEKEIYKERIIYSCDNLMPLVRSCNGEACFSGSLDLDVIGEMYYQYGLEEWGEREGRDRDHARTIALQGIQNETTCHWEVDGKIKTIASILGDDSEMPIIGSLFTNIEDRGRGYAKCLVHEIASQLTAEDGSKCGIISDLHDPITNKMFTQIGFEEISRYVSIHTTRETV